MAAALSIALAAGCSNSGTTGAASSGATAAPAYQIDKDTGLPVFPGAKRDTAFMHAPGYKMSLYRTKEKAPRVLVWYETVLPAFHESSMGGASTTYWLKKDAKEDMGTQVSLSRDDFDRKDGTVSIELVK